MKRLKALIRSLGMAGAAARLGVSVRTIQRWLKSGRIPTARLRTIKELSAAAGMGASNHTSQRVDLTPRERAEIDAQKRLAAEHAEWMAQAAELAESGAWKPRTPILPPPRESRPPQQLELPIPEPLPASVSVPAELDAIVQAAVQTALEAAREQLQAEVRAELETARDLIRAEVRAELEAELAEFEPEPEPEPEPLLELKSALNSLSDTERAELRALLDESGFEGLSEDFEEQAEAELAYAGIPSLSAEQTLTLAKERLSGGRPVSHIQFDGHGAIVGVDGWGRPVRLYAVENTHTRETTVYWTDGFTFFRAPDPFNEDEYGVLTRSDCVTHTTWGAVA